MVYYKGRLTTWPGPTVQGPDINRDSLVWIFEASIIDKATLSAHPVALYCLSLSFLNGKASGSKDSTH